MTTTHSKSSLAGLPLSRKLALMAILLLAPALALGVMFYRAQNTELQATRLQLEGVRYAGPFVKLLGELNVHRDAAALALARPELGLSSVRDAQAQVDRSIQDLGRGQAELAKVLQTDALTSEIVDGWSSNLKTNWSSGDAMMSLDLHTLVMAQVNDVVRLVGRKSRGSAPGESNTPYDYALMFELPASLESLGQLGAFGVGLAGAKPTIDQWDRLAGLTQDARRTTEALRTVVLASKRMPAELRDIKLTEATEAAVAAGEALLDATQEAAGGPGRSPNPIPKPSPAAAAPPLIRNFFETLIPTAATQAKTPPWPPWPSAQSPRPPVSGLPRRDSRIGLNSSLLMLDLAPDFRHHPP